MRKFWGSLPPVPSPSAAATHGSDASRSSTWSLGEMSMYSNSIDDILVDALQDGIALPITPNDDEEGVGESSKARFKPNNITDEDFARSLVAEEVLVHLEEQYTRSMSMSSETDRILQRILDGQEAFQTERIVADLAATLRPLQIIDRPPPDTPAPAEEPARATRASGPTIPPPAFFFPDRPLPWPPSPSESSRTDQQPLCCVCRCPIEGDVVRLDCGSKYDIDCLKRMFEANVDDEYRFPPRCCGVVVPLTVVENQLSPQTRELYKAKIAEYSTPWRLYCSNAQCARFLGARQRKAASTACTDCHAQTCALCTAPAHPPSQKCKIDKGMRKALKLGQSNGWQRCPRCRQLVERNDGCYHMSCRCGAQFCYLCADNWGRCKCWQRRRAFVKIILFRWLHLRGNYLVNDEPAASANRNAVTRLCRWSWKSVKKAVAPASPPLPPAAETGVAA